MGSRQALTLGELSGCLGFQETGAEVQAERRVFGECSGQACPCSAPGLSFGCDVGFIAALLT